MSGAVDRPNPVGRSLRRGYRWASTAWSGDRSPPRWSSRSDRSPSGGPSGRARRAPSRV